MIWREEPNVTFDQMSMRCVQQQEKPCKNYQAEISINDCREREIPAVEQSRQNQEWMSNIRICQDDGKAFFFPNLMSV